MSNNGGSYPRCGSWVNAPCCGNCWAAVAPEASAPRPPADDGKNADKWCRDNMNGGDTYTCTHQKTNAAH